MISIGAGVFLLAVASVVPLLAWNVARLLRAVTDHRKAQAASVLFYAGLLLDDSDPRDTAP